MVEIADADWDELQALAVQVGVAEERIAAARWRFAAGADRPGGPLTLLVGRPEGGIDLLFERWLGPEAAAALREARGRPLVVGANAGAIKPRQGSWPTLSCDRLQGYSLVAIRAASLVADVTAQLASLGTFEQAVLVTRWSQPLPSAERILVRPLAELAATARALVVTLPGESPGQDEIAEVKHFVLQLLRAGGFTGGRAADVGVWLTAGSAPQTVERLESFLAARPEEAAAGRAGAARMTFSSLLREVSARGRSADAPPPLPVDAQELQGIETDLAGYLKVLGETTRQRFAAGGTLEQVRAFVREQVAGWKQSAEWKQPTSAASLWLKYFETVRPGAANGLVNAAAEAAGSLGFEPPPASSVSLGWHPAAPWSMKVHRVVLGLVAGAAVYGVLALLLPKEIPLRDALASLGMMVGAIAGYALAPRVVPGPAHPAPEQRPAACEGQVTNWPAFQHAIETWAHTHITASAASLAERCGRLATKLDVSLED
jgi:hypothetical protein